MPLLDFAISDEVQEKAYSAWESVGPSEGLPWPAVEVVHCARVAADKGRCDPTVVGQVTGELLRKTVAMMTKLPEEESHDPATLQQLQNHAVATGKVITKAGQKVLAKKDVADLVQVTPSCELRAG